MLTKAREIKYIDEVDDVIDGLAGSRASESLMQLNRLLEHEEFRLFMSESTYLNEIVHLMLEKKPLESHFCTLMLEILLKSFNPYSFANLSTLFEILALVLHSILLNRPGDLETGVGRIEEMLERIPVKWIGRHSKCMHLEKVLFGLQICIGREVIKPSHVVCTLLKQLPAFELDDGFAIRVLNSRENYEILVNYTSSEEGARKLDLSLGFRSALEKAVLNELERGRARAIRECGAEVSSGMEPFQLQNKTSRSALRSLIVMLINLTDRSCEVNMPVHRMEEMYWLVDQVTRCYLAVLLLMYECQRPEIAACVLKREVRHLISACNLELSTRTVAKLARLSAE